MTLTLPGQVVVFLFAQVLCLYLVVFSPYCIAEQDLPKVAEKYLEKQMTFAVGSGGSSLSTVTGGQDYGLNAGTGFSARSDGSSLSLYATVGFGDL
jgi:hypothetical protein